MHRRLCLLLLAGACTGEFQGAGNGPGVDSGGTGSGDGGAGDGGAGDGGDGGGTGDGGPAGTLGILAEEGSPQTLATWPTVNYRGVDAAWDPDQELLLVVYGNAPIGGALLDADGIQVGTGFHLPEEDYDGANWTQNPRVAWGQESFLASWHRETGHGVVVQVRPMRAVDGAVAFDGPVVTVSGTGSQQESPAALAWSPGAGAFLVAWSGSGLHARLLEADGNPRAAAVDLTDTALWTEMPALVHVPDCACFFLSVMTEQDGAASVRLLRLDEATGAALDSGLDLSGTVDFAKVTDLVLDEARGEVVATWYEIRGGVAGFAARRLSPQGQALDEAQTIFAPHGSYDGYDLAWSPVTGTSVGAFHGPTASTVVAELAPDLSEGAALTLDPAGAVNGVFLPRLVAHPSEARWYVFGSPDYGSVVMQRVVR